MPPLFPMWCELFVLIVLTKGVWSQKVKSANQEKPLLWNTVPRPLYLVSDTRPADVRCTAKYARDLALMCNRSLLIPRPIKRSGGTRTLTRVWKIRSYDLIERKRSEFRCFCKAWGRNQKPIRTRTTLIKLSYLKERFGKVNTTYEVNINDSVVLKCNPPSGYPLPSVSWVKDGRPLGNKELGASNMRLTKKKKNLFIRKVKTRETGKYQCVVKNFAGIRRGPVISLRVKDPLRDCSSMSMTCNRENGNNSTISPQYDNSLLVATKTRIEQVSWEVSEDRFVIKKRKSYNTSAVDVALSTEKSSYWVYWTDGESIQKQNFNQNDQESTKATVVYSSHSTPEGIAVDWISKKLYWTDQNLNKIVAVDLQNDHRSVVVLDSLSYPRAITLDPQQGYMYWTEWGGESARIARGGMDGSSIKSVVTQDIWQPNGLAIDYSTKRLYWTDSNGTLQSSWLNGTNRLTIVNETGKFEPYGVAVWNGYVLWSDRKTNALYSVSEQGEIHDMVHGLDGPSGMEIVYPGNQPKGINPCRKYNAGCSYMCLLSPGKRTFSCVCKSNQVLAKDGKTCEEKSKTVSSSHPPSNSYNDYLVYILICLVVFLTIWLIISYVKNDRKMSKLLYMLKLRQKYGNHPNERTEPTEITTASLTAVCNNSSTVTNHHGNQATERCRGNGGVQPEEQNLLQNSDSTIEETSSSEAQKLTWITIKQYPKYLTRQYGGVAVIGDDAKAYCTDVQRQSSVDSLDSADDAV